MGQGDIPVDIGEVQNAWQIGPMKGDDPQLLNLPQLPTLDDIIKNPGEIIKVLTFPAQTFAGAGGAVLGQAAANVDVLVRNVGEEAKRAIQNAINTQDKALSDVAQNLVKSANDIVDAAHATERFAKRQIEGYRDVLSNAERRVREGKVVDAIWHVSTDTWQEANKNAAQLAEENEIIASAGQVVATAYGGPAGAAAYAAWLTYNKSKGNIELALKAGVYAYAVSSGNLKVGDIPTDTLGDAAKKAAMTGAVGGLAVAASGGSSKEVLDTFVKSGGAVVVQAGESYAKKNYSSVGAAKMDSFCVTAVGRTCAEAKTWYDKSKKRLDDLATVKTIQPTVLLTKDGQWSISWSKPAIDAPETDVPAVALTYVGDGSPFKNTINVIETLGDPSKYPNTWVAFRDVGARSSFFGFANPRAGQTTPVVGDELIANRDINIRAAPADWKETRGTLSESATVVVLEVKTFTVEGKQQEWIRIQNNAKPSSVAAASPSTAQPAPAAEAATGAAPTLKELIAAIERTNDKNQKKDLKLQARRLVASSFAFAPLIFRDDNDFNKTEESLSFVKYDPEANVLVIRRERKGTMRGSLDSPWKPSSDFIANANVKLSKLYKLTSYDDGSFNIDCNGPGGQCVTYDIVTESCNRAMVTCESEMNWYLRFPVGSNGNTARSLKDALVTVLYKIDGRPAK
ncbi:hypothetical protein CES86_5311 [Brucella lupini]|nr:hypothetical protein CES86_5311 [Brucella lupini]